MKTYTELLEQISLPISVGDVILTGKFKNKRTVVSSIEWNEKGDLLINGKSALKFGFLNEVIPRAVRSDEDDGR